MGLGSGMENWSLRQVLNTLVDHMETSRALMVESMKALIQCVLGTRPGFLILLTSAWQPSVNTFLSLPLRQG